MRPPIPNRIGIYKYWTNQKNSKQTRKTDLFLYGMLEQDICRVSILTNDQPKNQNTQFTTPGSIGRMVRVRGCVTVRSPFIVSFVWKDEEIFKMAAAVGGGGNRGNEVPASRNLYSRFPSPSLVGPASVCFFYCEILCNVAKFVSSVSLGSRPLGYPVSRPLFFRLPYTLTPTRLSPSFRDVGLYVPARSQNA